MLGMQRSATTPSQPTTSTSSPNPFRSLICQSWSRRQPGRKFRLSKRLNAVETQTIIAALDSRPNALERYLSEIDRVERFQAFHSGYRYVSWQQEEPFSWALARQYLAESNAVEIAPNQSPTGFWQCTNPECGKFINNWSLLRRCPFCSAMGTLQIVADLEETMR